MLQLSMTGATLLLFLVPAFAQDVKNETVVSVPVVDKSSGGSPFAITGTFWFAERVRAGKLQRSQDAEVIARNISSQKIITVVCSMNAGQYISEADFFLSRSLFEPGGMHYVFNKLGVWNSYEISEKEGPKLQYGERVEIEVMFAQFEDGSIFGDREKAKDYLDTRYKAWQLLNELKQLYLRTGEERFANALNNEVQDVAGLYVKELRETQRAKGSRAAFDQLNGMLALGEKRRAKMGAAAFVPARWSAAP